MTSEDNEGQFIQAVSADQFYASEHCRALREERNRHADNAICEQDFRQAEASVEFSLAQTRTMREQMTTVIKCFDR